MRKIGRKIVKVACIAVAITVSASTGAATMVRSGITMQGITEVNVEGYGLYDATFSNTWQGETYSQDFTIAATNALFNLFSPGGEFQLTYWDGTPEVTEGCESHPNCQWLTPYELVHFSSDSVHGPAFANWATDSYDTVVASLYANPQTDYTGITHVSWAVSSVPVPAAVWLFGSGLIGLIGVARRKKS